MPNLDCRVAVIGAAGPLGSAIVLLDSLDVPPALPDLDAIEQKALMVRPEIADIEAQQRAARLNSRLVREQSILPDITLSAYRDFKGDQGTQITSGLNEGDQVLIPTSGITGGTGFPSGRFPGTGGGGAGIRLGGGGRG